MKTFRQFAPLAVATVLIAFGDSRAAETTMTLAGEWKFALDPNDYGLNAGPDSWKFPDTIQLPGTTAAQRKGEALKIELNLEKPAMQHLHQRFPYVGPAYYQRTINIPAEWKDKDIILTLERVLWESRVWVDQRPIGKPQNSLSAPHRYNLSNSLFPGKQQTITLRIDNRPQVDIGSIGHAYTEETQTIWNGVIGNLKLEAVPRTRVQHLGIRTLPDRSGLELDIEFTSNKAIEGAKLLIGLRANNQDRTKPVLEQRLRIPAGTTRQTFTLRELPKEISPWSEFDPAIHQLAVALSTSDTKHILTQDFGLRTFEAKGRDLLVNDNKTFLRGNLECAIFPQTGHPDAAGPQWEKIMRTSRDYGLNHLRFHSWCPPKAAFEAADRHGIYLQVELPNWTFDMGRKPKTDTFLETEGERIIREYGQHPSFVMFSLGNELKGNLQHMDRTIGHLRKLAPDLLFTSTSYAFSPRGLLVGPQDDFFISQKTQSGWVRGQGFLNTTFPTTDSDYAEGLKCLNVPLVTHEVGQYVVYPNLAELPKYAQSPLRPTALESIQADLEAKGLLPDAARFTRDSGKLAALLYKEDIERALRTTGLAGIQLLQLQDFPGQSTATVGLLDAFWDSKGVIAPEAFRQFSSPVVPLVRMEKFVWENTETLTAEFELANFSGGTFSSDFTAQLAEAGGKVIASQLFEPSDHPLGNGLKIGRFEFPLGNFDKATRLDLKINSTNGTASNRWPVWVYPAAGDAPKMDFTTHRGVTEECLADLAAGEKVLLLPPGGALKKALPARFIPVFWSPLHFPNQPGTLGATIETGHPLWKHFPTDSHSNWQWWELTASSTAVDLSGLDPEIAKPFRFIDKYNRNALPVGIFEAMVGKGQILVCTLDVESKQSERIVARQLRRALETHISSSDFTPLGKLSVEQLTGLIGETSLTVSANSAHPDFPVENAIDDDPKTIWHSDWSAGLPHPFTLTLDFLTEKIVTGFDYLPRQDKVNGRIKDYRIEISTDGEKWLNLRAKETFPNSRAMQSVSLDKPVKTRHLRLVVLSEHGGKSHASCAEWQPRFTDPGDVRELGIIPGFNDSTE